MEQQIKREVATQTATAGEASAPRKREVAAAPSRAGLSTQDLILIAVLLAAGAVLKLTVGSLLSSMGMKPNFIIAMYCLAIILTRPKLGTGPVIGLAGRPHLPDPPVERYAASEHPLRGPGRARLRLADQGAPAHRRQARPRSVRLSYRG